MVVDLGCDRIMIGVGVVLGVIVGIRRRWIFVSMVFVLGCGRIQTWVGFGVGHSRG